VIVVGYNGEPRLVCAVEDYEGEVGDPSLRPVADTAGRAHFDARGSGGHDDHENHEEEDEGDDQDHDEAEEGADDDLDTGEQRSLGATARRPGPRSRPGSLAGLGASQVQRAAPGRRGDRADADR
jgi:hypothetical protein